jgi:hypothetical protein
LFLKERANECPGGTLLSAKGVQEGICASRGLEGLAAGRLPAGRKIADTENISKIKSCPVSKLANRVQDNTPNFSSPRNLIPNFVS